MQLNCHEDAITSIEYLPKAELVVTTSLDSTAKIWTIKSKPFQLYEIQRLYSHDYYYLSSQLLSQQIEANINMESVLLVKIAKHISANNYLQY